MAIFLQAYADKIGNSKLKVTLKIIHDLRSIVEKTFILPDKTAAFEQLTEDLYNGSNKPTYITKNEFKNNFINYTIALNKPNVDSAALTVYYNDLFKTSQAEAMALITQNAQTLLDNHLQQLETQTQNRINNYNQAKEENASNPPASSAPPHSSQYAAEVAIAGPQPTAGSAPAKQMAGLAAATAGTFGALPNDISNGLLGILGDKLIEPVPEPQLFPGDAHMAGQNNASITCTRDAIFGLRGHTKSGAIYMVAGRSPNDIQTEVPGDLDSGLGPGENTALIKPNDLVRDAAYIYLSQKSDPGALLKVAGGTYAKAIGGTTSRVGKSLAAIKADDVVIMARESGIRLITGTDQTNSRGGQQYATFGIDLIAGNNDEDLQPLVKGDNLVVYLKTLSKAVDELRAVVYSVITSQIDLSAALASHQHLDPFSIFIGAMSTGNPLAINDGKNYLSPGLFEASVKHMLESAQQQMTGIAQVQNRLNNDTNGLTHMGSYKILSEKNRTN